VSFLLLVERCPDVSQFRVQLGTALLKLGERQRALEELHRALKLEPGDANLRTLVEQIENR